MAATQMVLNGQSTLAGYNTFESTFESTFHSQPGTQLVIPGAVQIDFNTVDIVDEFLRSLANENTRKAYNHSLGQFFGVGYTVELVRAWLRSSREQIKWTLHTHRNHMIEQKQSPASINRRFAAVKSLLNYAHGYGICCTNGRDLIKAEKAATYRDTRGIGEEAARLLVQAPLKRHGDSEKGLRDAAMVMLFVVNGLRCNEVRMCDVRDLENGRLFISGKGRGGQKEPVTLIPEASAAIKAYLEIAGHSDGALFRNRDHRPSKAGARLSNFGIATALASYKEMAGVDRLTPHQLRHTAISNLLVVSNGNLFMVQKLSRHIDARVIARYWDNIKDLQGEASELLGDLFVRTATKTKKARRK